MEIISKDAKKISIRLKDVSLPYANALRRICLNGIPIFAVDSVDVIENTSMLPDEGLSHRLGLIPLKTDLSRFYEQSECPCNNDVGCSNCRVMLILDSENSDVTRTIFSGSMSSEDSQIKPISDKIPIVSLAPEQKIKVECYARLGRGTEHAKWNSSTISVLVEGNSGNEKILTVESTGALSPEQILVAGIEEVNKKLDQFKMIVDDIQ